MMFELSDNIVPIAVLAVVVFFLREFFKKNESKVSVKHPPSLPILPLITSMIKDGTDILPEHFTKAAETLGPIFKLQIGKTYALVLNSYVANFDAFVRHAEAFADRPDLWIEAKLLNRNLRGISFAHYDESWKKRHKVTLSILKEFGFGLNTVSETRILEDVETMIEKLRSENGRPIYPKSLLAFHTSNVVLAMLFGKEFLNENETLHRKITDNSNKIMENIHVALNLVPFIRFLPVFQKRIANLLRSSEGLLSGIEEAIECNKHISEITFVKRFMEIQGPEFIHEDLVYILRDIIFGSTDTVGTTIEWAIIQLANYPDIQSRMQREIDDVISRNRLPGLDDQQRLPYTQAVILEVMRRYSVGPFLVPHATLKDTEALGYFIPKGCFVIGNVYGAHMDQKIWKDPENFRPERFLDNDNNITNSDKLMTFGMGKRSCFGETIGRQEVFLFLVSLVQNFDIQPPENQKSIIVKGVMGLTLAPSHFEIRFIPRMKS